jgi:hypothetical protein
MIPKSCKPRSLWPLAVACVFAVALLSPGCEFGMDASGPECSLTPASLSFGTVTVGTSSSLSFVIENIGGATLNGYVTEDSSDFSIPSGAGTFNLEPGGRHSVTVRYTPLVPGDSSCNVQLGNDRCSSIRCTGTGSGPICDVDPTEIDFGDVAVGSYLDRTFNIRNVGDGVLTGNVTESYPHFSVVGGGGSFSLIIGQTHTVTVRFEPTTTGTKTGAVTTGVHCSAVALEGNATEGPECSVTPDRLEFGNVAIGSSASLSFEIENVGGGNLAGYVSVNSADYAITNGIGAFSLSSGEAHQVTVEFAPSYEGLSEAEVDIGTGYCSGVTCVGNGMVR